MPDFEGDAVSPITENFLRGTGLLRRSRKYDRNIFDGERAARGYDMTILPVLIPWRDDPGHFRAGCAFMAHAADGQHYLVTAAHGFADNDECPGACTADFSRWSREIIILWGDRPIAIGLFDKAGRANFKIVACDSQISDIIAMPIPEVLFWSGGPFEDVQAVDVSGECPPTTLQGNVHYEGLPFGGDKWPPPSPSALTGEILAEGVCTYHGDPNNFQGYSGCPLLTECGTLFGMCMGVGSGCLFALPGWYIWALLNDRLSMPLIISPSEVKLHGASILRAKAFPTHSNIGQVELR